MDFTYLGKTYKSKSTLDAVLYVINLINKKNYSGIISKANLTSYKDRNEANKSKSTLWNQINNLIHLGALTKTKRGGSINNDGVIIYRCSNYLIDKRRLIELYVLCTFLNHCGEDHSLTCRFSRYGVIINYEYIQQYITATLSNNRFMWISDLIEINRCGKDCKTNAYASYHHVNKIYLYFAIYYFLFLYNVLTIELNEDIEDSKFHKYLRPFVRDYYYNLVSSNELGELWDKYLEVRDTRAKDSLASPFDISRVNPQSLTKIMDASPNITFHLYLTLPDSLPICWFTDYKAEENDEFDLANLYSEDTPVYESTEEIVKKLKRVVKFETLAPIKIYTKEKLSDKEEKSLMKDYGLILANYSSILSRIAKTLIELRKDNSRGFRLRLNISLDRGQESTKRGWRYTLSVSGRHYNDMAGTPSDFREQTTEKKLEYFDLHSASFNVCRILNGLPFNADDDIKEDMVKELGLTDINGHPLNKDGIKDSHILYRCCFSKSKEDAINKYRRATDVTKQQTRYVDDETFKTLYDYCQDWCGGSEQHINHMFFAESLFELTIFLRIRSKSHWTVCENVYDCFYFDPKVISEEQVKQIANESVDIVKYCLDEEAVSKENMKQPIKLY